MPMRKTGDYDDAEEYLHTREDDIEHHYGKPFNKLTASEQEEALLDLFFGGLEKYREDARKMRLGLKIGAVPEKIEPVPKARPEPSWVNLHRWRAVTFHRALAWFDDSGKVYVHPSVHGEDRRRLRRHEKVYIERRKAKDSYTKARRAALDAEHEGLTKKQIRQYEGRMGAMAKKIKRSKEGEVVFKRYSRRSPVIPKPYPHRVQRDAKGRFVKWLKP